MEQQGYEERLGQPQQPYRAPVGSDLSIVGHSDWRRELRKTILSRVIPRLSNIGSGPEAVAASADPVLTTEQVIHFANLVLAAAVPGLVHYVDGLRAEGLGVDAIVLQLLGPAARHLGDLWLEDRLSFLDVTAGLGRLQGVLRALGPDFDGDTPGLIHGKKVLLAPVSGEQHIFGLSVVAAFFRRAGWDVTFEPRIAFDDLLLLARGGRFTAIGLSVGGDRSVEALPRQVDALRQACLGRSCTLMAGGPAFLQDPELESRVGVDVVARDATEAVQMAEALSGQAVAERPSS